MSPQRLFDPQQWNIYSYARNNPLAFMDPDGEAPAHFLATAINFHAFLHDLSEESRIMTYQGVLATGEGLALTVGGTMATLPRSGFSLAMKIASAWGGVPTLGAGLGVPGMAFAAIGASELAAGAALQLRIFSEGEAYIKALQQMLSADKITDVSTFELTEGSFELSDIVKSTGFRYLRRSQREAIDLLQQQINLELARRAEVERRKEEEERQKKKEQEKEKAEPT
jgi:hypothetical protein